MSAEVDDEAGPGLLLVPFETGEVRLLELVVGLERSEKLVCAIVATLTFFRYALWMASRASLMVTPLRFRAVTSFPNGKCRSIFLTGGVVKCNLRIAVSSTCIEVWLIFLLSVRSLLLRGSER